ncbi:MAG: hypothetical protein MRY63_06085 [Neomegalonema sp.]|nr:hypothetical protein [Neomegalonema sp.]
MRKILSMLTLSAAMLGGIGASALAGPDCDNPRASCASKLDQSCLTRLGAGVRAADVQSAERCEAEMAAYSACLRAVVAACPAPARKAATQALACDGETSRELWEEVRASNDCIGYRTFIAACPDGPRARIARGWLERLNCDAKNSGETRGSGETGSAGEKRAPSGPAPANTASRRVMTAPSLPLKPEAMARVGGPERLMLDDLPNIRQRALLSLEEQTSDHARRVRSALLAPVLRFSQVDLRGDWRCERAAMVMRHGPLAHLPFEPQVLPTRFTLQGEGYLMQADGPILDLSGALTLYFSDRMLFRGGFSAGISGRMNEQVGYLYALSQERLRLETVMAGAGAASGSVIYSVMLCGR